MRSSLQGGGPIGRSRRWCAALAVAAVACLAVAPSALAKAIGRYDQRNLVSDQAGKAELKDPDLVNAWGLAFGPSTPAWVADNGTDKSTLYQGGQPGMPVSKVPLTVSIPGGAPTGLVFNGSQKFAINGGPALFIFASEAGRITAWNQSS